VDIGGDYHETLSDYQLKFSGRVWEKGIDLDREFAYKPIRRNIFILNI